MWNWKKVWKMVHLYKSNPFSVLPTVAIFAAKWLVTLPTILYFRIREDHWLLCSLTYDLNVSLNGLILAFYIGNLYFLWNHFMSITWPPIDSSLYLMYQSWALIRQFVRFSLISYFPTKTVSSLSKPLRQAMSLDNSQEAKKLQVQWLKSIHSYWKTKNNGLD